MEAGFCVAGVAEGSSRWVRPVKRTGHIEGRDLLDGSGRGVEPLDLVEYELLRAKPERPHVEDWLANFLRRPVIRHRPSQGEREAILESLAETSLDVVVKGKTRSLVLIEPNGITSARFVPESPNRRYQVRLSFSVRGAQYEGESAGGGYPCTDLRLRNWGRQFKHGAAFNDVRLREALGVQRIFLAVGLSREFQGNHWPMVVGFHTCPDFSGRVDFDNP
jgi:hypothetical protein